jgi:DNA-binding FrmR family transcriptional regulator
MKIENQKLKDDLNNRLKRIEGQVRGVQKMLDEERECREIIQQLVAIRSAVQGVSQVFVQDAASQCLTSIDSADSGRRAELVSELVSLLSKVS